MERGLLLRCNYINLNNSTGNYLFVVLFSWVGWNIPIAWTVEKENLNCFSKYVPFFLQKVICKSKIIAIIVKKKTLS